jgi:hypothetical protein
MRIRINKTENEINISVLPELEIINVMYFVQISFPFLFSIIAHFIWRNYFFSFLMYILVSFMFLFFAKNDISCLTIRSKTVKMNININSIIVNYKVFGLQVYKEELYIAGIAKIYKSEKNSKRNLFYEYCDMARLIIEGYQYEFLVLLGFGEEIAKAMNAIEEFFKGKDISILLGNRAFTN